MRSVFSGIVIGSLCFVGCIKDEENSSSGGGVSTPAIGLVAGENFKNTANNATEVETKLNSSADKFGQTKMTKFNSSTTSNSTSHSLSNSVGSVQLLDAVKVQNFLSGSYSRRVEIKLPELPSGRGSGTGMPEFSLEDSAGCPSNINQLNKVYLASSQALKSAAKAIVEIETAPPEGLTKSGPTDQFAVVYTMDLSKIAVKGSAQSSNSSGTISALRRLVDNEQSAEGGNINLTTSGSASIGVGANDTSAVIALGYDLNLAAKDSNDNVNTKGEFAVSVNDANSTLSFRAKASANANIVVPDSNDTQNLRGSFDTLASLQAGSTPSIAFKVTASSNVKLTENEGPQFSERDESMELSVAIKRLNDTQVSIDYTTVHEGQTQKVSRVITQKSVNQCVVSK